MQLKTKPIKKNIARPNNAQCLIFYHHDLLIADIARHRSIELGCALWPNVGIKVYPYRYTHLDKEKGRY